MKKLIAGSGFVLCLLLPAAACAQVSLAAQLRTRSEFRNGQGEPLPKGAQPAFFTSQRSRLALLLERSRLNMNLTLQDVRVWGQDASTINRWAVQDNNGLLLHEAWADVLLTDTANKASSLRLKLGRQELAYDDQRLLGNLDWLQQGRRHDAALLQYAHKAWQLHAAGAFNQNREQASGTTYHPVPAGYALATNGGAMYKSMAFLHARKNGAAGWWSFLFFTDQFNRFREDTVAGAAVKQFSAGVWSRATAGMFLHRAARKAVVTASAYYQFGTNARGQKVAAEMLNLQVLRAFGRLTAGPGFDYASGGTAGTAFDPLYGTPHKFWGQMDYFYAAHGFGSGGLANAFLKSRFRASDRWTFTADAHQFWQATDGASFGQEVDLTGTCSLTKEVTIEAGYAHFFPTPLLSAVKNIGQPGRSANWAYLMVNIRPQFSFNQSAK